jgi:Dolichyl-phosphate-mannose-protein mannosyltransferase
VALLFFALAFITRLPFQTQNLWAHDSVLYERAIEHFDPLDQRPQPPGYLYYVLLIRAIDAVTGDANRAMTVVSLLADALAVALLYLLAARLYDERTARISALFLLTAVTFWAYGGIAYPYTLLAVLSIACALLLWRAVVATTASAKTRALLVASAFWGIAIGFRSDLAIFIAPIWLVAAWGAPIVAWIGGAATVGVLFGVWYAASAFAGGGLARFSEALRMQAAFVDERYSVFGTLGLRALYGNGYELARFFGRGLYFLVPLIAVVPLSAAARHIELADRRRALFVTAWCLSPLLVYIPIHSGEYGYVFSMIPALCVVAARGAVGLARGLRVPRMLPWIVAAVVLFNSAIFLLSDTPLSATDLVRRDRGTIEKLQFLQQTRELDHAYMVAAYDYLVVQHYVFEVPPGYGSHFLRVYDPVNPPIEFVFPSHPCDSPGLTDCSDVPILVVWDDLLRVSGAGWQEYRMPHGALLRIARDMTGVRVRLDGMEVVLDR